MPTRCAQQEGGVFVCFPSPPPSPDRFYEFAPPAPQLLADGRNVVVGRVLTGLDTILKITSAFTLKFKPATPIVISAAGRLPESEWAAVDKVVAAAEAAAAKVATVKATPDAKAALVPPPQTSQRQATKAQLK